MRLGVDCSQAPLARQASGCAPVDVGPVQIDPEDPCSWVLGVHANDVLHEGRCDFKHEFDFLLNHCVRMLRISILIAAIVIHEFDEHVSKLG